MDLTNEQRAAVQCPDPIVLVSAVPGAGKTRTLIAKIQAWGYVSTDPVTAITFTRKATAEMRQRLNAFENTNEAPPEPITVDTFHGLCLGIVRRCAEALGWREGISPIDETEAKATWDECKQYIGVKAGHTWDTYQRWLAGRDAKFNEAIMKRLQTEYHLRLRLSNYIDYDTIIEQACVAVQRGLYAIEGLVCVDEAQDTDARQYQFLKLILEAGHVEQLFIVGDVNQSIYAWRGARPELFKALDGHLGRPVTHFRLSANFRSGPEICRVADAFADEGMRSAVDREVDQVSIDGYPSEIEEAEDIRNALGLCNDGQSYAILYRNHSIGIVIGEHLKAAGIPFQRVGEKGQDFWQRPDVAAAVAWMRVQENPYNEMDFRRWYPMQSVDGLTVDSILAHSREERVTPYAALLKLIPPELETDYDSHPFPLDLFEIINTFETARAFLDWYAQRTIEPEADTEEAAITLSTVHAAKGREWDHVIIAGVDATVWPGRGNIDEERRLMYVAITRARKSVLVTYANQRDNGFGIKATGPSPFINTIREVQGRETHEVMAEATADTTKI